MTINKNKQFCYRICHIDNLAHVLEVGLCTKHHPLAIPNFVKIGNKSIIDVRDNSPVKLKGYGFLGQYVPFYFTPRSVMLLNIISGIKAPVVPKVEKSKIIVFRSTIKKLSEAGKFFFTDGQANDTATDHYNDLKHLDKIDWESIQNSKFSKSDDYDRMRRYQAEFLVFNHVPLNLIESITVYNSSAEQVVKECLQLKARQLKVHIEKYYFFD